MSIQYLLTWACIALSGRFVFGMDESEITPFADDADSSIPSMRDLLGESSGGASLDNIERVNIFEPHPSVRPAFVEDDDIVNADLGRQRKPHHQGPGYHVSDYPHKNIPDDQMDPFGIELHISDDLVRQVATVDVANLILRVVQGLPIPRRNEVRSVKMLVKTLNLRLHNVRIRAAHFMPPITSNDPYGRTFGQQTPAEQPAGRLNIAFLEQDHMKIQLRRFSLLLQAEYELIEFGFKGSVLMRALDSYVDIKVELTQNRTSGEPAIRVRDRPQVQWGKLDFSFDGNQMSDMMIRFTDVISNGFKNLLTVFFAKDLAETLPKKLYREIAPQIDNAVRLHMNKLLNQYGLPIPDVPKLVIQDLRWRIERRLIIIKLNLKYLDKEMQQLLNDRMRRYQDLWENPDPMVINSRRERLMRQIRDQWRGFKYYNHQSKRRLNPFVSSSSSTDETSDDPSVHRLLGGIDSSTSDSSDD